MLENHEIELLRKKQFLTIGEVAEYIDSTTGQIRKWERAGLMPPPARRVQRGSRIDRQYTWAEAEEMLRLRGLYRIGAPTAEEAIARQVIREDILGRQPA